jgi:hypothetical protein
MGQTDLTVGRDYASSRFTPQAVRGEQRQAGPLAPGYRRMDDRTALAARGV